MKIRIPLKLFLAVFGMMLVGQSCTNLDEELYSDVLPENFFRTEEEFISSLGAAYTSLYGFGGSGNIFPLQEVTTDEMVVPTRGNDWDDGGHWRRLHTHGYNSEDPIINGGWGFCYGIINNCNRLIFQYEQSNSPVGQAFIAELESLRAIAYLWLLDMYGRVPIVDEFDVPADFQPANNTRQEVFNFVETALTASLPNLSKSSDLSTYGRVNYWVAQAALAKLYMNAEVYTGTARWQDALDRCNEIINSGLFEMEADYFANFATNNGNSTETIFAIPYDQVFARGFNLPMMTLHYGSQATYNLTAQPWNGFCSLQEFYESYDERDVRRQALLVGPQYAADGVTRIIDTGAEAADPDGPPLTFTPEISELGPNALRQEGARLGKFEFALGATDNLSNDFPIYRYTDFLLMKAEALWRLNNSSTEALDIVNMIRERAIADATNPLPKLSGIDAETLLAERGREMFMEAHRRSDLIRFGKYNDAWWEKPADPSDHVNIFPIPRAQLDANKSLTQNPGY